MLLVHVCTMASMRGFIVLCTRVCSITNIAYPSTVWFEHRIKPVPRMGGKEPPFHERGEKAKKVAKWLEFLEDLEKVAKWVHEHGRLPRRLGPHATEAQREERREETRLATFLHRQQEWISGMNSVKPEPAAGCATSGGAAARVGQEA